MWQHFSENPAVFFGGLIEALIQLVKKVMG
jgi:hypothetical protein